MENFAAENFTLIKTVDLIQRAVDADLCGDYKKFIKNINPLWPDIDFDPDFSSEEAFNEAELLRVCGNFLCKYGRSKNIHDYQERGKDLLTKSVRMFAEQELFHKENEAQVYLAYAYFQSGGVKDYDDLLKIVEERYAGNELHPVYLFSQVNRLLAYFHLPDQYYPAFKKIDEIRPRIDASTDLRLVVQFYTQAGMIFRSLEKYELANEFYQNAISAAYGLKNHLYTALILNNFAYLYKEQRKFKPALDKAEESLSILIEQDEKGWIPHILDTIAQIYLDKGEYKIAFEMIHTAIFRYFSQGEDYVGHCDALWVKTLISLKSGDRALAMETFATLHDLATQKCSEKAARKYLEKLFSVILIEKGQTFVEQVDNFKKDKILSALAKSNNSIVGAARLLGLKSHQHLSNLVKHKYPELSEELGQTSRTRKPAEMSIKPVQIKSTGIFGETIGKVNYERITYFQVSPKLADRLFKLPENIYIAVEDSAYTKLNEYLLYSINGTYFVGLLIKKQAKWCIQSVLGSELHPLDGVRNEGKILGYAFVPNEERQLIRFKPFS